MQSTGKLQVLFAATLLPRARIHFVPNGFRIYRGRPPGFGWAAPAGFRNLYAAAPGVVDDRYCPVGARGEVDLSGKLL
ncbi:hypothetical protein, partial [Nocardia africana]